MLERFSLILSRKVQDDFLLWSFIVLIEGNDAVTAFFSGNVTSKCYITAPASSVSPNLCRSSMINDQMIKNV